MSSKYIVSYEHADCSGGALYVRSGVNATATDLSFGRCVGGVQVTTTSVPTTSYISNEVYLDLQWDYGVTERIIQHTCVWTGIQRGYVYADCQERVFGFFQDGDCKVPLVSAEDDASPPITSCIIPNAYSATSSKSKIPPKYLKRYEHADCTGAILYADEFTGAMAAAQDVDPCTDGFQIDLAAPKPDQFSAGKTYMSVTNPYMLFKGTVLDKSCVSYAPGKFVHVECASRTSVFFNDDSCLSGDQEVLFPSKVWGIHCGILNHEGGGEWWRGHVGILVGLVLISVAAGGIFSVLYRRNRKSYVQLPLKNPSSSQPSYHTTGRDVGA
ncbi:hypothetical protein H257_02362 [Aphanomyces astaci]|uniref:Uncharacterized protein n=1 Tax=Aphanomyces astaci TaxID=112090 RepID=W4H1L0_APHAT|nr:hypothetical protein H257_02362 [Aphanomyces astaci]ETV85787.1 hypothetical protein H257_02362 [Aphanomyces astaci]RQM26078.1 hypothetical protein B5M09_002525 [Aphanomyces astaci]|eukprot:XP_009824259.1 hypothetical protein H257_02362 [Aphanomyces astaci]